MTQFVLWSILPNPPQMRGGLGITQSIYGVGWAMKETSISHKYSSVYFM